VVFVFTEFSGQRRCFLTQEQVVGELPACGLRAPPFAPIREVNRPPERSLGNPRRAGAPRQWDGPVAAAAALFRRLRKRRIELTCLNLGGGFPARHRTTLPPIGEFGAAILESVRRHFGSDRPQLMAEPGRYLAAEAGVLRSRVVLVARRTSWYPTRWVYLDCGRFGGLAETADEAIKYPLRAVNCTGRPGRAALAGPTCDSVDILYERTPCHLPEDLTAGDFVDILSAGAYTHTYSAVAFNGFVPLTAVAI
jgi:ornithine decarboxylase